MQEDLSQLASELRRETCPRRVLDEVERQISQSAPMRSRLRLRLALVCAVAGFVVCVSVWLWQGNENARPQATLVEHSRPGRAQVVNQAQDALILVGSMLLDAGAHSEKIISERAVPPLRDSLEIARNKIIQHTEL